MSKPVESKPIELFYAEAQASYHRQRLVALGVAERFTNPAHPQFDIIRSVWSLFLAQGVQKPIVLYGGDGNVVPLRTTSPLIDSEVMAVKLGGEACFMATLADKSEVPIVAQTEIARSVKEVRGMLLGQKIVSLWQQGYSPFVLGDNDSLQQAHTDMQALPAYRSTPIALLPPESRYASLPQLAPTAGVALPISATS